MLLHSDILYPDSNQSLLLLLNAMHLVEKQKTLIV
jgi:hypothetical protein